MNPVIEEALAGGIIRQSALVLPGKRMRVRSACANIGPRKKALA